MGDWQRAIDALEERLEEQTILLIAANEDH
jgi:hypothetical protein